MMLLKRVWSGQNTGLWSSRQLLRFRIPRAALGAGLLIFGTFAIRSESLPDPILRRKEVAGAEQMIVVFTAGGKIKMQRFSKTGSSWKNEGPVVPAVIGYRGFAAEGSKREGDGRTPTGMFSIGTGFGYAPFQDTRMPYRVSTAEDVWVDDPASPQYNTWVQGKYAGKSAEKMLRQDHLYRLGLVVEYNTSPPVAGNGSAIFLHIWGGPSGNTAGCIAVVKQR